MYCSIALRPLSRTTSSTSRSTFMRMRLPEMALRGTSDLPELLPESSESESESDDAFFFFFLCFFDDFFASSSFFDFFFFDFFDFFSLTDFFSFFDFFFSTLSTLSPPSLSTLSLHSPSPSCLRFRSGLAESLSRAGGGAGAPEDRASSEPSMQP